MTTDSMKRLDSGEYYLQLEGNDYHVRKEVNRIHTGRARKGALKTTWKAFRNEELIGEAARYAEAKARVWEDARTPRVQTNGVSPFAAEQLPLEYDDGGGETPIGPPTVMERQSI
jgi:hypothetical protein